MVEEGQAEEQPFFDSKSDSILRNYMINGKSNNHSLVIFLNHAELIVNYFKKQKCTLKAIDSAMNLDLH